MSGHNDLFYEILICQHRGAIEKVANLVGCAYSTVHEYCGDRRKTPPVWLYKAAFLVTGDPRLKRRLEPEGYELVPKRCGLPADKPVEAEMTDVVLAMGRAIEAFRLASADQKITKDELIQIEKELAQAALEVAEAQKAVKMARGRSSNIRYVEEGA